MYFSKFQRILEMNFEKLSIEDKALIQSIMKDVEKLYDSNPVALFGRCPMCKDCPDNCPLENSR